MSGRRRRYRVDDDDDDGTSSNSDSEYRPGSVGAAHQPYSHPSNVSGYQHQPTKRRKTQETSSATDMSDKSSSYYRSVRQPSVNPFAVTMRSTMGDVDLVSVIQDIQQRAATADQLKKDLDSTRESLHQAAADSQARIESLTEQNEAQRLKIEELQAETERLQDEWNASLREVDRVRDQLQDYENDAETARRIKEKYRLWECSADQLAHSVHPRDLNNMLVHVREIEKNITEAMEQKALEQLQTIRTLRQQLQAESDSVGSYISILCPTATNDYRDCITCLKNLPLAIMAHIHVDDTDVNRSPPFATMWPFRCQCCVDLDKTICAICVNKEHAPYTAPVRSEQDRADGVTRQHARYVVRRCPWCKAVRKNMLPMTAAVVEVLSDSDD